VRVLIADDDDVFVQLLRELIDRRDEIVGVAKTGAEAIAEAERLHPDVVLMDLDMPVLEGDDATRRIVAVQPETKVVIVSGSDFEAHAGVWLSGAVAHVPKADVADHLPNVLDSLRGQTSAGTGSSASSGSTPPCPSARP